MPAYGVHTYSPAHVAVVVGSHVVTGFADGTFVEVEEMTDGITSESGADGEVARAVSADRRCTIKITLQQTSMSNDIFSDMVTSERVTGGMNPVAVTINDLRGRSLAVAGAAWFLKQATMSFGKELSTREWTLETAAMEIHVGGSLA